MSHLTTSLLNKPSPFKSSPFEFPAPRAGPSHPLSPPDTESEFVGGFMQAHASTSTSALPPSGLGIELEPPVAPTLQRSTSAGLLPQETLASRGSRKGSSLAYVNMGIRDTRERPNPPRSKWLVVVIPPAALSQDHGALGHTLTQGPRARLSQGILMPLFPTMYAQLTAIAREFNFPSVKGICLYLHMVESGIAFTPRVSDESWQLLWTHLFEARSPTPASGLPIGGRLEFDIDMRYARWWDTWLASSRKESHDVQSGLSPSRMSHFRGDSRTEDVDEEDNQSLLVARAARHIPKKLSLVDRFETGSSRSGRGAAFRAPIPLLSPHRAESADPRMLESDVGKSTIQDARGTEAQTVKALSPILQAEEPKSAKKDLEIRVKSWRASASLTPTPLALTGQMSLEPANMPNSVPMIEIEDDVASELNLDDFTWSPTSAGPPSDAAYSPVGWTPVPSLHLDRRAEGSVILTPTTVSSFGPASYDLEYSPISNVDRLPSPDLGYRMEESCPATPTTASSLGPQSYAFEFSPRSNIIRLPSPDLAWRQFESCPPTPTTASSWGPLSDYGPSRAGSSRAPSVDLAHRGMGSRPATPSTATSWGPASWPASPVLESRPDTPDVAGRGGWSEPVTPAQPVFRWRRRATQDDAPSGLGYPFLEIYPPVPSLVDATPSPALARSPALTRSAGPAAPLAFPYYSAWETQPWTGVWPYAAASHGSVQVDVPSSMGYPTLEIYPPVGSPVETVPAPTAVAVPSAGPAAIAAPLAFPYYSAWEVRPWVGVWPYAQASLRYPTLEIYPAASPHVETRASSITASPPHESLAGKSLSVRLVRAYPHLDLYPATYPDFDLYPAYPRDTIRMAQNVSVRSSTHALAEDVAIRLGATYPAFMLYPVVQYPHNLQEIYPARPLDTMHNKFLHVASQSSQAVRVLASHLRDVTVRLGTMYPTLTLYPVIQYPHNLQEIYPARPLDAMPKGDLRPAASQSSQTMQTLSTHLGDVIVGLGATYPALMLYPAVQYPHNLQEIYPAWPLDVRRKGESRPAASQLSQAAQALSTRLGVKYPVFDLYPAVYPVFNLYPGVTGSTHVRTHSKTMMRALVTGAHPRHDHRPKAPHSPHPVHATRPSRALKKAQAPPLPSLQHAAVGGAPLAVHKRTERNNGCVYPCIVLYSPVYPHLELYPAPAPVMAKMPRARQEGDARSRKAHLQLHAEVFPMGIVSTPSSWSAAQAVFKSRVSYVIQPTRKTHLHLHAEVFSTGIVATPSSWADTQAAFKLRGAPQPTLQARTSVSVKDVIPSFVSRPRKTHQQLRDEAFPTGSVSTPSSWAAVQAAFKFRGMPQPDALPRQAAIPEPRESVVSQPGEPVVSDIVAAPPTSAVEAAPTRPLPVEPELAASSTITSARRISISRPRSGTVTARPPALKPVAPFGSMSSPNGRQLPMIPDSPNGSPVGRPLPPRPNGLPSNPAQGRRASVSRPLSVATSSSIYRTAVSPLAPLGEDEDAVPSPAQGLSRTRSMASPSRRPLPDPAIGLERSKSTSGGRARMIAPAWPKDSVVAERARTFNAPPAERVPGQIMNTLKEFPMPPLPPLPGSSTPPRADEPKASVKSAVNRLDPTRMAAFSPN